MHFLSQELEDYVAQHSQDEPALLAQLYKETYQKVLLPRMLSGHFQGRVLSLLSKLVRPVQILEIGTFTGYSALCLCEGLQQNGQLHTIDIKEELVDFQRKYFDKSGFGPQIFQYLGNALDIIPSLGHQFDLVFIDADKENYISYFDLIISKMNKGGIILTDNVLWSGKVLSATATGDTATANLKIFNTKIKNDPRVETILLPIRDGLTVCRIL